MTTLALPDVFRRAADIIGERGWTRGTDLHPESGAVCANGALRLACGSTVVTKDNGFVRMQNPAGECAELDQFRVMKAAHNVLNDRLPADPGEALVIIAAKAPKVIIFNDRVATSGVEVQGVLRDTADWLEAHPLSMLARIEDQPVPFTVTEAGVQALDNNLLAVSA